MAAAKVIRDYKDGAWLVDLAPISSNELVAREITEVLNIPEVANKAIVDTLVSNIRDMNLLIILDNCEHLIKTCSEIAGKLLQSVPGLHILATSREALNVTGEKVWRVPSLTLLDPKTILDVEYAKSSEAVLMFIDRARLNNPEFELQTENVNEVATICHKLDGIPLAIELVASRTRYMNTEMILDRFSDRFDSLSSSDPGISKRQQTLQSTIEWSYNLLTEDEKALFSRLSVFSGGFDLSAVEEVCSDDQLQKEDILELLSRLVDRSMVYTVKDPDLSMRYTLLETLRQFAQQVLQTSDGETDIRNRHLQYYLKLAEESYAERMEFQHKWMKKLEAEHDNMIASLNWSEVHAVDQFVRLSAALAWYWSSHSYFSLGMDYLERALSMDVKESEAYAHALYGLGMFLWFTGDFKEAEKRYGLNVKNGLKYKNEVLASIDLQGIAFAVGGQKRWAKAIRLNAAARENARALGAALPDSVYFWREWLDTYIGGARQELGQDLTSKYEEEGIAMGFDKAVEYALNFDQN